MSGSVKRNKVDEGTRPKLEPKRPAQSAPIEDSCITNWNPAECISGRSPTLAPIERLRRGAYKSAEDMLPVVVEAVPNAMIVLDGQGFRRETLRETAKQTMTTVKDVDILLVEDDPSDIELTIYSLKENNLATAIYVAEDGKEALDFIFCRGKHEGRLLADRPKLIVLDLKLQHEADGLEVLKAIRSDERTKAIPVVILTSSKERGHVIEGYKAGASAFIQKPVDFDHYRKTIKEIGTFWLVVNQSPPAEVFGIASPVEVPADIASWNRRAEI